MESNEGIGRVVLILKCVIKTQYPCYGEVSPEDLSGIENYKKAKSKYEELLKSDCKELLELGKVSK